MVATLNVDSQNFDLAVLLNTQGAGNKIFQGLSRLDVVVNANYQTSALGRAGMEKELVILTKINNSRRQ
jgi:hypothetical protein